MRWSIRQTKSAFSSWMDRRSSRDASRPSRLKGISPIVSTGLRGNAGSRARPSRKRHSYPREEDAGGCGLLEEVRGLRDHGKLVPCERNDEVGADLGFEGSDE